MAKEQVAGQEALGTAMNKTEFFFEKNGKLMSYISSDCSSWQPSSSDTAPSSCSRVPRRPPR